MRRVIKFYSTGIGTLLFILIGIISLQNLNAQTTVKVVTYNLQGMKPGTDPESRILKIINQFKKLDPDVIGLQEINENLDGSDNQMKQIVDSLTSKLGYTYYSYQQFTHSSWDSQFREYVGIISKFPMADKGSYSLPRGAFPRYVVWVHLETPAGNINVFNTHLSFNEESVRIQQVNESIIYIDETENSNPGLATIFTGDFNAIPSSDPIKLLTDTGTDTFFVGSYFIANPGNNGYTVPSNGATSKIDYIFYRNSGAAQITGSNIIMTLSDCLGNVCSDHLGIKTVFDLSASGLEDISIELYPQTYTLDQNYPNQFNPSTTIRFRMQKAATVNISVFDISGKHIRTITHSFYPAGNHEVSWDGTSENNLSVGSGIYFYRMQTGNGVIIKKMILLR